MSPHAGEGRAALSIQQPWAWLIVHGHKSVENRTWPTNYRGPLLIHAGKTFDHDGYEWVCDVFGIAIPTGLDVGGIVGHATLTACVREHPSPWFFGPFGFVLTDAAPMPLEPCRGQLGIFRAPKVLHE